MCKALAEGGKRCNGNHTVYGKRLRSLQAKKQYYTQKVNKTETGTTQNVTATQKLEAIQTELTHYRNQFKLFGAGQHYVMDLTPKTVKVLNQLETDGLTPYIVGGSVRDALLNLNSKDIDIEVYGGTVEQVVLSLKKVGRVDEVGKAFGVLKIALGDEDFDVSLPRTDSRTGDGHTGFDVNVDPHLSLEDATARRDYTINALMYSHRHGYIVDKHDGIGAINNHELKHVSDAFDEDPLRVLRGVQMASRFGMTLHPDTVVKAKSLVNTFDTIATERVQIEFQKLYEKGKSSHKALQLLKDTGWDENFPGLKEANTLQLHQNVERMQKLIVQNNIEQEQKPVYLSAVIAAGISNVEDREKFLNLTCVGSKTKNLALQLTKETPPETITPQTLKTWAHTMKSGVTIRKWVHLQQANGNTEQANHILSEATKHGVVDAYEKEILTGEDVTSLAPTLRRGRWVGENLTRAREAQYAGLFATKKEALQWLEQNFTE